MNEIFIACPPPHVKIETITNNKDFLLHVSKQLCFYRLQVRGRLPAAVLPATISESRMGALASIGLERYCTVVAIFAVFLFQKSLYSCYRLSPPLQAHLRNKSAKEPSAPHEDQPPARGVRPVFLTSFLKMHNEPCEKMSLCFTKESLILTHMLPLKRPLNHQY